jgi:hypothetical protein
MNEFVDKKKIVFYAFANIGLMCSLFYLIFGGLNYIINRVPFSIWILFLYFLIMITVSCVIGIQIRKFIEQFAINKGVLSYLGDLTILGMLIAIILLPLYIIN